MDAGAKGAYVKHEVLKNILHKLETALVRVQGRYSSIQATHIATFSFKLPEFCSSKTITVRAYVEENAQGRHDLILGRTVCRQLGLVFDFKHSTITWDDVTISMRQHGTLDPQAVQALDPADRDLPTFMQNATGRLTRAITSNMYDKHNYRDMVLRCSHLTKHQQQEMLNLFAQYEELFSGTLGAVPVAPVHLNLKPGAKPFRSWPYTIPQVYYDIARKEVDELVKVGVLKPNVPSPWGAPCLLRPKKDGGVHFLTDLRKLNDQLIRSPFHLPNIDDIIWKMQGFTFATCLDLNRGYYHFRLDEASQKLCAIVLPWGRYVYLRLPQGCCPSSDIFQGHMTTIFAECEDVLVFIDNILLYTKKDFAHHVQRLHVVLAIIKLNNLHVHVEDTFLAAQSIDYLGYTLTTRGIQPQTKKIIAILAFSPPKNARQLCAFLGFVNYYKKLWYRRSHTLEPLTRVSGTSAKFVWTDKQANAFHTIKHTIARQVLLRYPNFSLPFDIYTYASEYQSGGVICQNGFPVAFYSRKLSAAQRNYTTMEKELLSIIKTAEAHRNILLGFKCRFHSDHKNLTFKTFKSERVKRWHLLLEEYDYEFYYPPGKDNVIANMLSRYPILPVTTSDLEEMNTLEADDVDFPLDYHTIANEQSNDRSIRTNTRFTQSTLDNVQLYFYKNKIVL